ncbi:MAG: hemolysin family protein [Bdellovibrionota bacterium]
MAELFIIFALILINGMLAMAEIAIVSSRRARLEPEAEAGNKRAQAALRMLDSPTQFLSTIQIGMSLIGIFTGVYSGATIASQLGAWLSQLPLLSSSGESIAFGLVVIIVSYFTLVLGELLPKRIAMVYPEQIAKFVTPVVSAFSRLCSPLVRLLERSTQNLLQSLHIEPQDGSSVTEDEIHFVVAQGAESGIIERTEEKIVHEVLRLGDRPVSSVMTPRTELVWLSLDDPFGASWVAACESPHTHYPVGKSTIDEFLGVVSFHDIAMQMSHPRGASLEPIIREPLKVPSTTPVLRLIDQMKGTQEHVALVVDEYGGLDGLVTARDVMEAVFGELAESDLGSKSLVRRDDGSWLVDAGTDVEEVFQQLGIRNPRQYDHAGYHSFGGFVLTQIGRIPREGESFEIEGFRFEIVDMDRMRIDKILVVPLRDAEEPAKTSSEPTDT